MISRTIDLELARKLYEEERMSIRGVARHFHISDRQARKMLLESGVTLRKQCWEPGQADEGKCIRCGILLTEIGDPPDAKLCHWCREELEKNVIG